MKAKRRTILTMLFLLVSLLVFTACASAAETQQNVLSYPDLTQVSSEWAEDGTLTGETFTDLNGAPAVNNRGFYRSSFTWDEYGNKLSEAYYGLNGELTVNKDLGYARAVYTYFVDSDDEPHLLTEDRYDASGNRADIPGMYSYRRDTWQSGDVVLSSEFFDANGNLTRPAGGYAQILYQYEQEDGYIVVTKTYHDADGSPLIGTEGGYKVVSIYTTRHYLIEKQRIEYNALDMMIPEQVQTDRADTEQLKLSTAIYDADGNRTLGSSRWHKEENTYDIRGNLIRTDYTDMNYEPILAYEGYASVSHTYDDKDRIIESDYYGIDGNLIKTTTGYAKVTFEYYEDSNWIHYETYYGTDDQRTMTTYGYSRSEHEYHGKGFDYRITYYDTVDEYTMCLNGYARIEFLYMDYPPTDENQLLWDLYTDYIIREQYFGPDMELIEIKAGYAGLENERNRNGQVLSTTYMDKNWKPVRNNERQLASIRYQYASSRYEAPPVYEEYFDKDGNPCESTDGCYARRMTYGGPQENLLLSEEFLDAKGGADVNVTTGAHRAVYAYNGNTVQTSVRYYDAAGKPFKSNNGYASLYREYTSAGSLIWEATLDENGDPVTVGGRCAAQVHSYDYSGHHTAETYFAADRSVLTQSEGYASVYYTYDLDGNITSITYYNSEHKPVPVNGAARIERQYDRKHHIISEAYFGADLQPVLTSEGYASRAMTYDDLTGQMNRMTYMDKAGKPVVISSGYATFEMRYDINGNMLTRAYYDADGNPVNPPSVGYARFERKCDDTGNVLEEASYDADGSLIENMDRYAVLVQEYVPGQRKASRRNIIRLCPEGTEVRSLRQQNQRGIF